MDIKEIIDIWPHGETYHNKDMAFYPYDLFSFKC